jgi:hypothetical protein
MKILILTLSQISPLQPWHNQPQQKTRSGAHHQGAQSAKDNAPLNIRACLVPAMPASAAYSVRTVLSQVSGQT